MEFRRVVKLVCLLAIITYCKSDEATPTIEEEENVLVLTKVNFINIIKHQQFVNMFFHLG